MLYFRHGCGLCDEMKEALDAFNRKQPEETCVEYQLIDIDSDEGLRSQYNDDVPLLMQGDVEILKYFFDEAQLMKVLNV